MQDLQTWQATRQKPVTALEAFEAHFAKADATLTGAART
jgi:hypothetical protein